MLRVPVIPAAVSILFIAVLAVASLHYFSASDGKKPTVVVIEKGANRLEVASTVGSALEWDERNERVFASTYAQMQWAAFGADVETVFSEQYAIDDEERLALMISSTQYLEPRYDFLSTVHVPGIYEIPDRASHAEVADILISRVEMEADPSQFIAEFMEPEAAQEVLAFIRGERELLPDLVPLPPRDLTITDAGGQILLSFSTTYYNRGDGPLEFRADPNTAGIEGDVERDVFQRIYREDGEYRDRAAGTFLWHQPHLHYHFADFVIYDLEAVDVPNVAQLSGVAQKSTFCVRDVSRVDVTLENALPDAEYKICGKERQGIAVGWGDTYFYTYPDQNLNITDLASGTYRLLFIVNPEDRFDEITKENNVSSALLNLDIENLTVEVLEEVPSDTPTIEHVYEEQVFK
jgi:hypothetical protein